MNIKFFISFIIFTNFLFCMAIFWFGLGRPIINFDYLFLLLFCAIPSKFISKTFLFIILFVIYSIDILLLALQIFPFVRLNDIIYLSNFIFNGPILYRALLIFIILYFFVNYFIIRDFFIPRIKLSFRHFGYLIISIFLLLFVKHLLDPLEKDEVYARFNKQLFASQTFFFIKHQNSNFMESVNGSATKLEPSRFNHATKPLFEHVDDKKLSKKILLVVNESWGETAKSEHQDKILAPILDIKDKLDFVEQGSFSFIGATVAGELRELCHKQPTTFNLKDATADEFQDCLPNKLKARGYSTYAMHGAMSVMYDRSSWYPKAGFEHVNFFEQLNSVDVCRAFSGRCDVGLIPFVKKFLNNQDRSFVYWLTLNTHAPYDDQIIIKGLDCSLLKVKDNTETCNNYKLQYQFFSALSQLINDPDMSGLEVYVVGDHSPPIFNMSDNFFSFKGSDVAWIHFKVK